MKYLFEYNWQVRNEWFELLKSVPEEELYKKRIGGLQNIAHTLFHIIVVEYYWINDLQGKAFADRNFQDYVSLDQIIDLSEELHVDIAAFVHNWSAGMEDKILDLNLEESNRIYCTYGEVMRHVIAHEIHHMGQLSVWAREIGIKPVSANFIHRGIIIDNKE